ncbi:TlyA family RNA methyltransferase [Candidatus Dependentiae bacterium]|nr:TlyA family RNA methyltransferase [Candidatus Dependentiae bacterium]
MKEKKRLDILVQEKYPQYSRTQIQSFIMQNKVSVDGHVINKPGQVIDAQVEITLNVEQPRFVSRAGLKLQEALDHFNIDVKGLVVLDAGLSTGGFADCLLQAGASKIYGVDVGYGQVHEKIRHDSRVVILEKTNLRNLKDVGEKVDLVTLDLSFISILKVMDAVKSVLKHHGQLITLIKPQFEAGKNEVGKGGIIRDPILHKIIVNNVTSQIVQHGFELIGVIESPILGSTGNKEFLAYFKRIS